MGRLTRAQTEELLREPIISIITTLGPDGAPHMTPVWHLVDGDEVVMAVGRGTVKARNVRGNPAVSLCVVEGSLTRKASDPPQRWVLVNGEARLSDEGSDEFVRAVSLHYLGEEEGRPYAEEALAARDFTLIRIAPTRVVGFDGLD